VNDLGNALHHAVALVIGKEKYFVRPDRAAEGSAKLVLVIASALAGIEKIRRVQIGVAQKLEAFP